MMLMASFLRSGLKWPKYQSMPSTSAPLSQITVNGAPRARANLQLVSDLIAELKLDAKKVAIERNLAIVPRSEYATTQIMDGDAIEIVGFIGGG